MTSSPVYAGTSRPAGGIFAGLRHHLLSRLKRFALEVEQVYRWLCHTAGTPIRTVRTRSYLMAHVPRSIAVRVPDQLTQRADVQPTFDTIPFRYRIVRTILIRFAQG